MQRTEALQLGEAIRHQRQLKGYSQLQLTMMTTSSQATISRLELGQVPNPSMDMLTGISKALSLKVSELLNLGGL